MNELELKELVVRIQNAKAEFQTVEVKRSKQNAPERLFDTLSSFSNQEQGGVIVFGLDESSGFAVTGVDDVQLLQKKVMEQCNQMEPPVRAVFTVTEYDGLYIVSAEIPPVDIAERPCFYKGKGRVKGSYIRIGDADQPMTEYEIYSFEAYRRKLRDDIRPIERAAITSLNQTKLDTYLLQLKTNKPNIAQLEDAQILELMGMVVDGQTTLAAQLLFGLYPQAYMPQLGIIAVSVPGNEIGDVDTDGSRFIDNQRIEGTIAEMLETALQFVRRNTHNRTIVDEVTGKRRDRTDYPMNAVREVILNALVHRDYSFHTEGTPIELAIFADRMTVRNPGGLYGRLTLDQLGKAQPDTRNPVLATALEIMNVTENRYSGIPTIRREMQEHGLPEPEFQTIHGEFIVTFRLQNPAAETDGQTAQILEFCRIPRSRQELAKYLGLSSVTYAIKKYVFPLVEAGQLRMTHPDNPGSPQQRFVTVE